MPLTLVATVAANNANSYVTREEANAYFDGRLNADAWTAEPDVVSEKREQALVMATSILDRLRWVGALVAPTVQRLQWPRSYVPKPYDPDVQYSVSSMISPLDAAYWPEDAVPRPIKEACFELALELLRASSDIAGEDTAAMIIGESVGPISTQYAQPGERPRGLMRFPQVWGQIAPYLLGSRQQKVVRA